MYKPIKRSPLPSIILARMYAGSRALSLFGALLFATPLQAQPVPLRTTPVVRPMPAASQNQVPAGRMGTAPAPRPAPASAPTVDKAAVRARLLANLREAQAQLAVDKSRLANATTRGNQAAAQAVRAQVKLDGQRIFAIQNALHALKFK